MGQDEGKEDPMRTLHESTSLARLLCLVPFVVAFHVACATPHVATHESVSVPAPRLILQITVDQLRADLPRRVQDRLGEGGFRYLLESGVHYDNAHHGHANTETVVGHTTLATGADPSTHGMVANVWFDHADRSLRYNVEDPRYRLLTGDAAVDRSTEIDPTQKTATTEGRSPSAILVSTFADELALFTAGRSKIFGVSVKDRGAITLAGHAGKAFWFSKATMRSTRSWTNSLAVVRAAASSGRLRQSSWRFFPSS